MKNENQKIEEKTEDSNEAKIQNEDLEESPSPKRFHNDKLMITSVLFASIITFLIYTVPDWVFLEVPIRDLVHVLLSVIGIVNEPIPRQGQFIVPMNLRGGPFPFLEATEQTPGIYIPLTNGAYYIVKACTAMQAGALFIGIILVTETSRNTKMKASILTFMFLFFMNVLRLTFHFWSVTILFRYFNMDAETAFYWGHDVSTKIIGFIGAIILAFFNEKLGVPVIDQFADWLDYFWWRGNSLVVKFTGK